MPTIEIFLSAIPPQSKKSSSLAKEAGAEVKDDDISIAQRLPSRTGRPRSIIVRFTRRVKKIDLLHSKKTLKTKVNYENIRVFEDIPVPRLKFFNLMKSDSRIANVWTREGTIFYKWVDDNTVNTLRGLFDAGIELGYNFDSVESCFIFINQ